MRACVFYIGVSLLLIAGCASSPPKPDWVSGPSPRYPSSDFLSGVGEGDARKAAEADAYGAISRIFVAEIDQKTREWESYFQTDSPGGAAAQRTIEIRQVTAVSTQKVLENVRIAEVWKEDATGRLYALAVLDRAQTSRILQDRIGELDSEIRTYLSNADPSTPKIRAARNLYHAVKTLLLRDVYNTDLRIVHSSGEGAASPINPARVAQDLYDLTRRLNMALEVSGPRNDEVRIALLDGLGRHGFTVLAHPPDAADSPPPDVLIRAAVNFQPVPNPRYRLVRWTADFEVSDPMSGKVLGSFSKSGREGQMDLPEAENRAVRALQEEAVNELSGRLADFILGKEE